MFEASTFCYIHIHKYSVEFVTLSQHDPWYFNVYYTCKLNISFSNHLIGMIGSCLFGSSDYPLYNCEVDLLGTERIRWMLLVSPHHLCISIIHLWRALWPSNNDLEKEIPYVCYFQINVTSMFFSWSVIIDALTDGEGGMEDENRSVSGFLHFDTATKGKDLWICNDFIGIY